MKICFICNEYPPMPGGGIGVFISTMAESLAAIGVEVWVIGYGQKRKEPFVKNNVRVKWVYLPYPLYKKIMIGGYPYSIASLIKRHFLSLETNRLVRNNKIDIVESYDFSGPLAIKPLCKFVVRLHGSVCAYRYGEGRPNQISPVDKHFEKKQVRMADHVIAVSNHIGNLTNQAMHQNHPFEVIYNGVDTGFFLPNAAKTKDKSILFIGNLMQRKGVIDLINAMPLIHKQCPESTLLVAGGSSGEHETLLRMTLDSLDPEVRGKILLLGKIPHEQLPALYNQAGVVVFPSREEAFGLTCAEAMSCGRPIVATNLASGPELVEDGISGLLADPRDPTDLASKICTILDDSSLAANLSAEARKRALEHFDLIKLAQINLAFYHSIL